MLDEYKEVVSIVAGFDKNLLLIKGWGVTFGLATLALGFKEKSRGIFITAALSALCFWILEAETKWHQSNYYLRMNQIELWCQTTKPPPMDLCPKIDWSWREARSESSPFVSQKDSLVGNIDIPNRLTWYIMPHVFLPHLIVLVLGGYLGSRRGFERWIPRQAS